MNIKIIDCTIRDGGHISNWNYDVKCVKAAYYAAIKSGIDYFEIGYRFPDGKVGIGPFGFCKEDFVETIIPEKNEKCKIAVMIDVGKYELGSIETFNPKTSVISAIRVAMYPYELEKAIKVIEEMKFKGYEVFLQLMVIAEFDEAGYMLLGKWQNKEYIEAIYFADSFGSFIPNDMEKYINKLKSIGFNNIGFHAHNNLQMAFANTLKAIELGAKYVDASIFGMGRGAGNLPIEILLSYLEKNGNKKYNPIPYIDVIERYFVDLFDQYRWGYRLESLLGGIKNIHPYYVQDLYDRKTYTIEEIWHILDVVKEECPISYSVDKLDKSLKELFFQPLTKEEADDALMKIENKINIISAIDNKKQDSFGLKNKHKNKKFVILANGPSVLKYQDKIKKFIKDEECITIGLNYLPPNYNPDYHVFINKKRFLKHISSVDPKSNLIIPTFFGENLVNENYSRNKEYFNIKLVDNYKQICVKNDIQFSVFLNVATSAILLAYQMGAKEIIIFGMDGYYDANGKEIKYFYNEDDIPDDKLIASFRYEKLQKELEAINQYLLSNSVSFLIGTPTSHKKYYQSLILDKE